MNHDRITNSLLEEQEITAAKTSLEMSVQRFEMALDNLAHRIGTTVHSIQHVKDVAGAPKRVFLNAKGVVQDYSERAISTVRANPRPFIYSAVGVIGASVALYLWLRRPASVSSQVASSLGKTWNKSLYKPFTERVLGYF